MTLYQDECGNTVFPLYTANGVLTQTRASLLLETIDEQSYSYCFEVDKTTREEAEAAFMAFLGTV
jgi:hypothetical protein